MKNYSIEDWIDTALVCENGHVVNSQIIESPKRNKPYCTECGQKTISSCPNCNANIQGRIHYASGVNLSKYHAPKYCDKCGKPYPWTIKEAQAAQELINLTDLNNDDKKDFIDTLRDISVEGPRNIVGVAKIKIFLGKIGNGIREDVKEVITNIATEVIKEKIKNM